MKKVVVHKKYVKIVKYVTKYRNVKVCKTKRVPYKVKVVVKRLVAVNRKELTKLSHTVNKSVKKALKKVVKKVLKK